jgi:peptidoglycan hydrolase-like protein with peptidoglycan-binding domain
VFRSRGASSSAYAGAAHPERCVEAYYRRNVFLTTGDIGEDGSPIPPLTLDGTAGEKTKQAVLAFQTAAHLATDATIVGPLTWRNLVEQDF